MNHTRMILHSLGGYDEISLTGDFKYFYNKGETIASPSDLGLPTLTYEDLRGGDTVEESAAIFLKILEGNGTSAQNATIIANSGMALFTGHQNEGLPAALARAKEALQSGGALTAFKKLLNK